MCPKTRKTKDGHYVAERRNPVSLQRDKSLLLTNQGRRKGWAGSFYAGQFLAVYSRGKIIERYRSSVIVSLPNSLSGLSRSA